VMEKESENESCICWRFWDGNAGMAGVLVSIYSRRLDLLQPWSLSGTVRIRDMVARKLHER